MPRNIIILIFGLIENLIRFLESVIMIFGLFIGILTELFIFPILFLDL